MGLGHKGRAEGKCCWEGRGCMWGREWGAGSGSRRRQHWGEEGSGQRDRRSGWGLGLGLGAWDTRCTHGAGLRPGLCGARGGRDEGAWDIHQVDTHGAGRRGQHGSCLDLVVIADDACSRQVDEGPGDNPDGEDGGQRTQRLCGVGAISACPSHGAPPVLSPPPHLSGASQNSWSWWAGGQRPKARRGSRTCCPRPSAGGLRPS